MSKVGKQLIAIPSGVTVTINKNKVNVKGPLGELHRELPQFITAIQTPEGVTLQRANDLKQTMMNHGTFASLIKGMVEGVTKGFVKELELVGVGYNFKAKGKDLELNLGFSHPILYKVPNGVKVEVKTATELKVSGIDKQLVGLVASIIKKYKMPEPYGGKGIKYKGEHIRRKAGKAAAAKGK